MDRSGWLGVSFATLAFACSSGGGPATAPTTSGPSSGTSGAMGAPSGNVLPEGGTGSDSGEGPSSGKSADSGGSLPTEAGSDAAAAHDGGQGQAGRDGGVDASVSSGGNADAGGTDAVTLVPDPSWTCGMPAGIPPPTQGTTAFSVSLTVSAIHDVGKTQFGKRRQLDISGGTITGQKLDGTVLTGGLDYELTLSTGAMEVEEVLIWKTNDGTTIFTRVCGVAAPGDSVVRVVPDIEAPSSSSYAWLNTTALAGTRKIDSAGSTINLDVYDVSRVAAGDPKVQLIDPTGVPNVAWDCVTASGTDGSRVFTENVTLGSTIVVSNAKRGTRNIIPITGGTTTGMVAGQILNGGADYQLVSGGTTALDARYTLAPADGGFIIVRNCGPSNGLTPVFETATDGPYSFLTTGKFLSSAPGSGSGGVSITFYDRQ